MCLRWKSRDYRKELSITEIREIFSNPLFDTLEKLVITGGEPTLREDVVQIAQTVLESCPKLREISLRTNGLEPSLVTQKVKELLAIFERNNRPIKFSVAVSLDGFGVIHDQIRGVPQAFEMVCKTIERLQILQLETPFYLSSNCTVQPLNIDNLVQLSEFGKKLGLPVSFSPVVLTDYFVDDPSQKKALVLTPEHYKKMKTVLERELQPNLAASDVPFWRDYFSIMSGRKKRFPCSWLYHIIRIDSNGTLCTCKGDDSLDYGNVRENPPDIFWYSEKRKQLINRLKKEVCHSCPFCCDVAGSLAREFFHYTWFWLKEKSRLR